MKRDFFDTISKMVGKQEFVGKIENRARNIFLNGVAMGLKEEDFRRIYIAMTRRCLASLGTIESETMAERAVVAMGIWLRYALGANECQARNKILAINSNYDDQEEL